MSRPTRDINSRITKKLVIMVILFSSLITFITTSFQLFRDYEQSLSTVERNFAELEETHLPSIKEAVWNLDLKQLQILLDGIVALRDIRYVELMDQGRMLASSGQQNNANGIQENFDLFFERDGKNFKIGDLMIEVDLTSIYQRLLDRVGVILLSNGIKTFFVAIFISFIFGYLVTRHLTTIATYTKQLTSGGEGTELKLERQDSSNGKSDELDDLVTSINEMQSNIRESQRELQKSHDELEFLVEKRTAELSEREAQLNEAQSIANIGSWYWDINSSQQIWSPEQFRIFGIAADTSPVTKDTFLDAVHPEDKKAVEDMAREVLKGEGNFDTECRIIRPNAEIRFVHVQGSLTRDHTGMPASMLGTVHDITSRKQTEQQYRYVLNNLADGAITIGTDGNIGYINPMVEQIFGYSADELIGSNIKMLMPEPDRSQHDEYLMRYMETGRSKILGTGRQVTAMRKDGTTFPADLNISKTTIEGETTFFGTLRDMTERVKTEKDLVRAKLEAESSNRVKSEFLANMSHELRTPLNAIIGFSETLSQEIFGPLGGRKQEEYLENIHQSGIHLLNLINDILDVSAIEADKFEFLEADVDMNEVIEASLLLVTPRAQKGQIELKNTLNGDKPVIRADERRMKQVLVNLISNAVKFNRSGGKVSVGAQVEDDGSRTFTVADTGIGMNKREISLALEPFRQVRSSLTDDVYVNEGTGLGLPLTLKLVEGQGGNMSIESEPNVGTTVSVQFPAERVID